MRDPRSAHRYTPYFCEENIWWLARELCASGDSAERALVCLFSNTDGSIAVLNQRAALPGRVMAWDYHVVLACPAETGFVVFDLDTVLPFPSPWPEYFRSTFPEQARLPRRWRSWVRLIPVRSFLERFCSDRSHMIGHLPHNEFPPYPPICPDDTAGAVTLAQYRDMTLCLDDESRVREVEALSGGPFFDN